MTSKCSTGVNSFGEVTFGTRTFRESGTGKWLQARLIKTPGNRPAKAAAMVLGPVIGRTWDTGVVIMTEISSR